VGWRSRRGRWLVLRRVGWAVRAPLERAWDEACRCNRQRLMRPLMNECGKVYTRSTVVRLKVLE